MNDDDKVLLIEVRANSLAEAEKIFAKIQEEACNHQVCVEKRAGKLAFGPPHKASPNCESGGHSHCTCDTCF